MRRTFLFLLVALLPMVASAYDAYIDGIYYNFSGNEATVTYQSYSNYKYYSDYTGTVVIPSSVTYNGETYSVTSIDGYAFQGCTGLTSVTIPNSVKSIGWESFSGCSGLTKVIVHDIAAWCGISFNEYSSHSNPLGYAHHLFSDEETEITDLVIPNGVTRIGNKAFLGCSGLTSVTIPGSVTSIGISAFPGCTGLTSITIPNSVTSIGDGAFSGCTGLTSVTIPNSVTSIGIYAFDGCSGLTSVTIPNSVTNFGESAFSGCTNLTKVIVPDIAAWCGRSFSSDYANPLYYAKHIFSDEETEITDFVIPDGVTSIGNRAFSGCSGLTSVTIPGSVEGIGQYAFSGCTGLTSVTICNGVTSIGGGAFSGCKLRNVLIRCTTPPSGSSAFSNQTYYHTTLYIPIGSWDTYAYDDNWYLFHNIRETATAEEQLTMQQAYTMMDAEAFAYTVYDPVNDRISTISSIGIDENNPNHSWQVIEEGGSRYLYNMGAKKFVETSANGTFTLTDTPTSIEIENGSNGIIIGTQKSRQWALVSNERLSAELAIITGVSPLGETEEGAAYDLSGRQIVNGKLSNGKLPRGINIIRMSDGMTRMVMVK